jgi:hypothetical protein
LTLKINLYQISGTMSDDDWGVDTEEKPVAEDKKEEPKE